MAIFHARRWGVLIVGLVLIAGFAAAQDEAVPPDTVTLGMMIQNGGLILWAIGLLSVVTVVLAVYLIASVSVKQEAPREMSGQIQALIATGDRERARRLCDEGNSLLGRVAGAGLACRHRDRYLIQEAMEGEGQRGAAALWQRISWLNNVGMIAPLMGLLGTVWGMIQAFGSIALDDAEVRGLRMAESVSQAMITTAAGLLIAIPAYVAYFYLRGQVIKILAEVESQASGMVDLMVAEDDE